MNHSKNKILGLWIALGVEAVAILTDYLFITTLFPDYVYYIYWGIVLATFVAIGFTYKRHLSTRAASFTVHAFVSVALTLAIVGVVNFLAKKHPKSIDLTRSGAHTLSEQTEKVVKSLNQDVKAVLFSLFPGDEDTKELLDRYQRLNSKFSVESVDPYREPTRAKEANIKRLNSVYLEVGKRKEVLDTVDEENLTNSLIKLLKTKESVVCSITGHGEREINLTDGSGYSESRTGLEDQAYTVKEINLPKEGTIPSDCSFIAVLGPSKAFFDNEIEAIHAYLKNGGRALVTLDVDIQGKNYSKKFADLLEKWFVSTSDRLILDPLSQQARLNIVIPIIAAFSKSHSITKDFVGQAFFPFSRALEIKKGPPTTLKVEWFAKTLPSAWAESDYLGLAKRGEVRFDEGQDKQGELLTGVAIEGKLDAKDKADTRIVVFGSTAFASNDYFRAGGNGDLFLNAASWLMADESLIAIRQTEDDKVELTLNNARLIFWSTVLGLPAVFAFFGIAIWFRRRKL